VARLLIVGGGCRALQLARELHEEGHALLLTTRDAQRRSEIEATGAQCLIADPDRLATLHGALEGVTVVCWLLATASGSREQMRALHGPRLRSFLSSAIDSTARGLVYEAHVRAGAEDICQEGVSIARELCARNSIPLALIEADPAHMQKWLYCAKEAVESILG
jgi:hypothetical protein